MRRRADTRSGEDNADRFTRAGCVRDDAIADGQIYTAASSARRSGRRQRLIHPSIRPSVRPVRAECAAPAIIHSLPLLALAAAADRIAA